MKKPNRRHQHHDRQINAGPHLSFRDHIRCLLTSPSSSSCSLYRDFVLGCDGVCCGSVQTLMSWTDAWRTNPKSLLNCNTVGHFKFLCPIIPRGRRQRSLYLCEDTLSLVSSSTFSCSSSLHCRPSSSEWTLMTSLITCSDQNIEDWKLPLSLEGIMGKKLEDHLSVGLLGDVNVLSSVRLTSPLIVPHLRHQLQVSLWFILLLTCRQTDGRTNYKVVFLIYIIKIIRKKNWNNSESVWKEYWHQWEKSSF